MKKPIILLLSYILIISCQQTGSDYNKNTIKAENKAVNVNKKFSLVDSPIIKQNINNEQMSFEERQKEKLQNFIKELQVDSIDNKPIEFYLNNNKIDTLLLEFYNVEFLPDDGNKTFLLLEILTQKNDTLFPLYFHCLNKICEISDGALSEIMGKYCLKMIINYPNYSFNYLSTDSITLQKYANFIGYEMYFKEQGTSNIGMSYDEFKEYLKLNLDLNNQTINYFYNEFFSSVDGIMKEMN